MGLDLNYLVFISTPTTRSTVDRTGNPSDRVGSSKSWTAPWFRASSAALAGGMPGRPVRPSGTKSLAGAAAAGVAGVMRSNRSYGATGRLPPDHWNTGPVRAEARAGSGKRVCDHRAG